MTLREVEVVPVVGRTHGDDIGRGVKADDEASVVVLGKKPPVPTSECVGVRLASTRVNELSQCVVRRSSSGRLGTSSLLKRYCAVCSRKMRFLTIGPPSPNVGPKLAMPLML